METKTIPDLSWLPELHLSSSEGSDWPYSNRSLVQAYSSSGRLSQMKIFIPVHSYIPGPLHYFIKTTTVIFNFAN